jgi:ABC-type bacteriocin/lantibiotic exporter with double-glycine peptidase domain
MSKTYKLIKSIAFVIFAVGVICLIVAFNTYNDTTAIVCLITALSSLISGCLFLALAKLIEQNEERIAQNDQLNKLLTEELRGIKMKLKSIENK